MKIECPVCGAPLCCLRVKDGKMTKIIPPNKKVTKIDNKSNGYDYVYCSNDRYHVLSSKFMSEILNLVN